MTLKRGLLYTAAAALAVSLFSGAAVVVDAAPILPGHLVVTQVGDGINTVTSNATPVSVLEMTTSGSVVQTIPMPTAASGANNPYAASGTQSEQHITLSGNGTVLTLGGYNATPGTTSPANSTASRIIGIIPLSSGVPDTSTALTDFGTGTNNNLRSVVTPDGVQFYATTANAGTRYVASPSSTTSTQLNAVNARNANIFNGQLYVSSGSGTNTNRGVNTVGTGLPTLSGQAMTRLPGLNDTANASSWDFFFADDHTLYIVDDSSSGTVGGLQKWKLSDDTGQWSQLYRVASDGTVGFGLRSIAGYVDGGNAVLFVTNNQTQTRVLTMTDPIANTTLAAGQVFTGIYTSPANTQVRGIEFIPAVPEPGSMSLLIGAGAMLIVRRGRKSIA